jgi:predicted transposase YdaD
MWTEKAATRKNEARHNDIVEGMAQGIAIGITEGRSETTHEIALKMKKAKRPFNEISEFTGLSIASIEKL